MNDIAIRVDNLSKRFRIGKRHEPYLTLRDSLTRALRKPFQWANNINGTKSSDHIWALKDVSFEIKRGEVVGVVGRNGAGKSTLLKILSKITRPTAGYAEVWGRVGSLLEVGTGFHPELTGRENVYLSGAILGMKRAEIERKFDEIVEFAGVQTFLDTPLKHYSSGMFLRLAFSVAAHLEPEILLVDEVLTVGDVEFQSKCLGKMGNMAKEGRTVLFVTHNLLSLKNLCPSGILLKEGMILAKDRLEAVLHQYLNADKDITGEMSWQEPSEAPGDETVRLKTVRIVSEDTVTGEVPISKEFRVETEYWNLRVGRRWVSIHVHNSLGVCVFVSANHPSASLQTDEWYAKPYPCGVFRTCCTIPGLLLNDGLHTVSVFVNGRAEYDNFVCAPHVLSFTIRDTGEMRKEHAGSWGGAVRPRLDWQTMRLD